MYPDCFGSCGHPMLLCPNCVCLKGPDNCRYFEADATYVYFDAQSTPYKTEEYKTKYQREWEEKEVIEGNLCFMTFLPGRVINLGEEDEEEDGDDEDEEEDE